MAASDDNVGGLVAGILIAGEKQRQLDQANYEADRAKRESAELLEKQKQAEQKAKKATAKARAEIDDLEDDLEQTRNIFLELLSLPLDQISKHNARFNKNYQALMLDYSAWILSQKAFREVAIRLGDKLGLSSEDIVLMADDAKQDVLSNKNPAFHWTNAKSHSLTSARVDALKERLEKNKIVAAEEHAKLCDNGTIYNLLDHAPTSNTAALKTWLRLAEDGVREAQLNAGYAYDSFFGCGYDPDKSAYWLQKALDQGEPRAAYQFYLLLDHSSNPLRSREKAEHYLEIAVKGNDPRALAVMEKRAQEAEKARQEKARQEELQRWADEEASLLEQLSVVREGVFPKELFDKIANRKYPWRSDLEFLHTANFRFEIGEIKNVGTLFSPNRVGSLSCYVTNPNKSFATFKMWREADKKFEKALYMSSEKHHVIHHGRYSEGTTFDRFTLQITVKRNDKGPSGDIVITYIPKCPVTIRVALAGGKAGHSSYPSGGKPNDVIGAGLVVKMRGFFLLASVLAIFASAWYKKDNLLEFGGQVVKMGRHYEAAKRMEAFSDFSKLSDWPISVQETYRKEQDKPLEELLEEIPESLKKLSHARKEELGAQIWFKISSKGGEAAKYMENIQRMPHRVKSPVIRAGVLSVYFLHQQCEKGFEVACLDAAKSIAGLVWNGTEAYDENAQNELALKQLPSSGPLAKSASIVTLRQKLSSSSK